MTHRFFDVFGVVMAGSCWFSYCHSPLKPKHIFINNVSKSSWLGFFFLCLKCYISQDKRRQFTIRLVMQVHNHTPLKLSYRCLFFILISNIYSRDVLCVLRSAITVKHFILQNTVTLSIFLVITQWLFHPTTSMYLCYSKISLHHHY